MGLYMGNYCFYSTTKLLVDWCKNVSLPRLVANNVYNIISLVWVDACFNHTIFLVYNILFNIIYYIV